MARQGSSGTAVAAPAGEGGEGRPRTRIKAVVNIKRVELEMLRNILEHRTIEPLARFQVLCRDSKEFSFWYRMSLNHITRVLCPRALFPSGRHCS